MDAHSINNYTMSLYFKSLILAIPAIIYSKLKSKPIIFEVRDLWPDSIVAVGSMTKSSKSYKILKKIEHHLYHSASKIVVVTDSFKKYIIKN